MANKAPDPAQAQAALQAALRDRATYEAQGSGDKEIADPRPPEDKLRPLPQPGQRG